MKKMDFNFCGDNFSKFGVLGAESLGEGVEENAVGGWSGGRLSPPFYF